MFELKEPASHEKMQAEKVVEPTTEEDPTGHAVHEEVSKPPLLLYSPAGQENGAATQ